MKIDTLLDVNVVAHEAEDEVAVLLDLEAPAALADATRPHASLEVVLDRSGSMRGAPLAGAKKALTDLVRRLEPTDNFGLVAFDDSAQVVVPAGPLTDKDAVIAAIGSVQSGGMTDLSAGYLRGLRELRRVAGFRGSQARTSTSGSGGTVLVVSDGHVNGGIRDVDEFASVTAKAYGDGVVTSTLGYGHGYDETLLAAIARAGSGNHVFAADPDAAGAAIAGEVDGLLNKVVQALSVTVRFEPAVEFLRLYNDLPAQQIGDGAVMIEVGDLYSEEARKLLLKLKVPAMAALGPALVATLDVVYVELPGLVEHTTSLPVNVNVVPGDEAAARVPHPTVHSEVLFQEAQEAKRKASEAYEAGDVDAGDRFLLDTGALLGDARGIAPDSAAPDLEEEITEVEELRNRARTAGASYASKLSRASYHAKNRKRGRRTRDDD